MSLPLFCYIWFNN